MGKVLSNTEGAKDIYFIIFTNNFQNILHSKYYFNVLYFNPRIYFISLATCPSTWYIVHLASSRHMCTILDHLYILTQTASASKVG